MARAIKNIKKGQLFIVLSNKESNGFDTGFIIESIKKY